MSRKTRRLLLISSVFCGALYFPQSVNAQEMLPALQSAAVETSEVSSGESEPQSLPLSDHVETVEDSSVAVEPVLPEKPVEEDSAASAGMPPENSPAPTIPAEKEGVLQPKAESTSEAPKKKQGLLQEERGIRYYLNDGQQYIRNGWKTVDGKSYYFDEDGYATVGLLQDKNNGVWYYFHEDGTQLKEGWKTVNGDTYYFNGNGVALRGLQRVNGVLHYFNETTSVQLKEGWKTVNGKAYYFNGNGVALRGLHEVSGVLHYFNDTTSVQLKEGWKTVNGNTYYFNWNGTALRGLQRLHGVIHYFHEDTAIQLKNGWKTLNGDTYYFNGNGVAIRGLYQNPVNKDIYYFNDNGVQRKNGWANIGTKTYLLNERGIARKGLYRSPEGVVYGFDNNGVQYKDKAVTLEGTPWYFNKHGVGSKRSVIYTRDGVALDASRVRRSLLMESTAYTHTGYPTATGAWPVAHHTVAVDPSVIPMGTKMYVEGYGYAVAQDTGGAIVGNIIDVFLDSEWECIQWGRRHVMVYILD